jgi:arylformamidase
VQIFDVSVAIRPGMPIWPGDPELEVGLAEAIADGAEANVTRLALGAHTGTHADAPVHFIDGAAGVEELPLEALVGSCVVVDAEDVDGEIAAVAVPQAERVLFKTRNSELWERDGFVEGSVCLSSEAAAEVVRRGIRLVGIDYLTIGGPEAHRILLAAGVPGRRPRRVPDRLPAAEDRRVRRRSRPNGAPARLACRGGTRRRREGGPALGRDPHRGGRRALDG